MKRIFGFLGIFFHSNKKKLLINQFESKFHSILGQKCTATKGEGGQAGEGTETTSWRKALNLRGLIPSFDDHKMMLFRYYY